MVMNRLHGAAVGVIMIFSAGTAASHGIPVIDQTAILKHIESIAQLKSQLTALHQQIEQAQQLYGSLNKLTDMADVANVLNDPAVRKALPSDFATIEDLLKGTGSGVFGHSASRFVELNSNYRTDADDFYAKELSRIQAQYAGQMSLGQQIYNAATKRMEGIDELRGKISSARDAKEIADLQARLQAEQAFLQLDVMRMEGLQMVQRAQAQVDVQRKAEEWRQRMDSMKAALR
ncbi:P-type DNA transfer protein VirB5 [Shinella sp.]|uniref:P-type DNA transfer protein VirB5 n=1 Tax=Shinella sp. TaxID=1870904 RepID=UPI002898BAA0|nr:P-type DNA transfer protein VirB5 [Shinella sp.]